MSKIVWIEGIVGMGKSTLAEYFSKNSDYTYLKEPVDENEYLQDFYENTKRWAFPMQMELLYRRFEQHWEAQNSEFGFFVFDRGITGDKVFANMLFQDGLITSREYKTYIMSHRVMINKLRQPDLIIYLDGEAEWAYERVRLRDRVQEETLPLEYLKNMKRYYEKIFLSNHKEDFVKGVRLERIQWTTGADDTKSNLVMNMSKSILLTRGF